ncbi:MAG: uracil-DNA glycosylase [Firmicutes bacterium]|jgi:uracil-DNA glycosylase family 4|nr:uracil-DNA glycosylase [Bacillota bacterium]
MQYEERQLSLFAEPSRQSVTRIEAPWETATSLADLARFAVQCHRCRLRAGCRQVVFGEGDPAADLIFVGEGPGQEEDAAGLPFVGRAGQLLTRILAAAGLERGEVYITNVVKCRPPGNRLPQPDEVQACKVYLEAQIRIIRPKILVCLGALAAQTLIDPRVRITRDRGKWAHKDGILIMPTFHPAALLRDPYKKKPVWIDIQSVVRHYRALPGRGQE